MHDDMVTEMCEVVSFWEVRIKGCPDRLHIKILKLDSGQYMGIPSLQVKAKDAADFYMSLHPRDSIKEARDMVIDGFLMFWDPDTSTYQKNHYW